MFFAKLLQRSARRYLTRHTPYVIGITGSMGKTTCRTIMTHTLRHLLPDLRIESSEKNFNTESGLPLSILGIHNRPISKFGKAFTTLSALCTAVFGPKQYDLLVAEYGIDTPGDMDIHLQTCIPSIAILTGIDLVHAEGLHSPDITITEKIKLINSCTEIALIHQGTYPIVKQHTNTQIDLLTFALSPEESDAADIWFRHHLLHQDDQDTLQASFDSEEENDTITHITTNLLSYSDAGYSSLAIQVAQIVARRLATPLQLAAQIDITIPLQPGRRTMIPGQYGSMLIDSSYNASPKSMRKIINDTIKLRNQFYTDLDLVYVLGDMRELGEYSEKEHRTLMAQVAQSADAVYLVGPQMGQWGRDELIKLGYNPQDIHTSLSSKALGHQLLDHTSQRQRRSLVLFKGSQNTIFTEEALKPLLKAGVDAKSLLCRQDDGWMQVKENFYKEV